MTGLITPEEMTSAPETRPASPEETPVAPMTDDLAAVRELIVRTHADAVPELIDGATIGELLASIEPAREAFARIAALSAPPGQTVPAVPAGGAHPAPIDPKSLSPAEKIRRGLGAAGAS
jgi:hypothetical protein